MDLLQQLNTNLFPKQNEQSRDIIENSSLIDLATISLPSNVIEKNESKNTGGSTIWTFSKESNKQAK